MNFGVVGSSGMEGVDIDGYILPDASHIVTDGKNEIGRRAIDYAARRKISCKIETNKRKLRQTLRYPNPLKTLKNQPFLRCQS